MAQSDFVPRRVFIASTYDLAEERRVAAESIREAGAEPVFVDWLEPSTLIGRAVLSSDLLLMIVGERYGTLTTANISYLEYEYRLARRAGIPIAAVVLATQSGEERHWFNQRFSPDSSTTISDVHRLPSIVRSIVTTSLKSSRRASPEELNAVLRIVGRTGVAVSELGHWFADLDTAYSGILTFLELINDAFVALQSDLPYETISRFRIGDFIAPSERLRFQRASFSSDGWWEVFGKLNPLEVIRQYLNDRHEHRKDREYREAADRTRLDLENELLKTKVIGEKLRLARDIGIRERRLVAAANELLLKPLRALKEAQDEGIVIRVELIQPPLLDPSGNFESKADEDHSPFDESPGSSLADSEDDQL